MNDDESSIDDLRSQLATSQARLRARRVNESTIRTNPFKRPRRREPAPQGAFTSQFNANSGVVNVAPAPTVWKSDFRPEELVDREAGYFPGPVGELESDSDDENDDDDDVLIQQSQAAVVELRTQARAGLYRLRRTRRMRAKRLEESIPWTNLIQVMGTEFSESSERINRRFEDDYGKLWSACGRVCKVDVSRGDGACVELEDSSSSFHADLSDETIRSFPRAADVGSVLVLKNVCVFCPGAKLLGSRNDKAKSLIVNPRNVVAVLPPECRLDGVARGKVLALSRARRSGVANGSAEAPPPSAAPRVAPAPPRVAQAPPAPARVETRSSVVVDWDDDGSSMDIFDSD